MKGQNSTLDLHMHSDRSLDGELTPQQLMDCCRRQGLQTVSLTDHNSVAGVAQARDAAEKLGMHLITGVELDCSFEGVNLHVLGYGIDPRFDRYRQIEADVLAMEQSASAHRLKAVRGLGIHIGEREIQALSIQGVINGEMMAEAALAAPENRDHPLLAPYRPGGARSENPLLSFYWDHCAQGMAP